MRTARKLTLKREALAELTAGDLSQVAGGEGDTVVWCRLSVIVNPCPTRNDPVCDRLSRVMQCLTPSCL